jgi:hypothetical protein
VAAGWPCAPYDLRHFNASLLIKEARLSPQEIAGHLGHTLIELSRTYAHELTEYRGRQVDIDAEVAEVRARAGEVDVLRQIALELGAAPSTCPEAPRSAPARRRSQPESDMAMLIQLNASGVLTDSELAAKLRQIKA